MATKPIVVTVDRSYSIRRDETLTRINVRNLDVSDMNVTIAETPLERIHGLPPEYRKRDLVEKFTAFIRARVEEALEGVRL